MATTTGTFVWYNKGKLHLTEAGTDLDADNIKVALFTSTYSPTVATDEYFDAAPFTSNEVSATGYTAGGLLLASKVVTDTAGVIDLDSADPLWSIGAGGLTARFWVLYNDTPVSNKPVICYGLLDDAVADVTITSGNDLTYNVPAAGWFTYT